MPTLPPLETPAAESEATCPSCGSTLIRTGKPTTFADGKGPAGKGKVTRPFKGWVPALLITICPTCDVRPELAVDPAAAVAAEPAEVAAIRESYLERLARETDEQVEKDREN